MTCDIMKKNCRVLIVDDTYEKIQVIASIIQGIPSCDIDYCNSSRDAIKKIQSQQFDLMIVDLQIPDELGAPLNRTGGQELIEYCTINDRLKKPTHILGVTSHQESYDECKQFFAEGGWPLLLGVSDHDLVRKIVETKVRHSFQKPLQVDIAIVTALHKIELEAVLQLPCDWEEVRYENDNNKYYLGVLTLVSGEKKSIVATSCSRMGMASAAATTMKVCSKFSPQIAVMTGIAAGVEGKTQFGDVLVADPCWDWGSGKRTIVDGVPELLNAPHQVSLDTRYRTIFQEISANRTYLDEICCSWDSGKRPGSPLNLHIGPLATGAVVLEDPGTVQEIVKQHRETIGVEMEAYGFAYATTIAENGPPKAVVIKSVCDFANPDKNDNWQGYAAYTSAKLAYHVLVDFYQ